MSGIKQKSFAMAGMGLALLAAVVAGRYGAEAYRAHRIRDVVEAIVPAYGVDPELVMALIWQESRYRPHAIGAAGEHGLMQVTLTAAEAWAVAEEVGTVNPDLLLEVEPNLRAGTWYLARALHHWRDQDDPVPYALAQYNAGRRNALRWAAAGEAAGEGVGAFMDAITYPGTRAYIERVLTRYRGYVDQP